MAAKAMKHTDNLGADGEIAAEEIDMDALEQVSLIDRPTSEKWALPLIHRISVKNVVYHWRIAYVDGFLITRSGTKRAPQYAKLAIKTNTSKRDLQQQAYQQATRKFKDRFYEGYQLPGASEAPAVTGMKGQPYKEGKIKHFPVLLSAKLDGVRVLARHIHGREVELLSYKNRDFNHLALIKEQVTAFIPYLPAYATLDGEAYSHSMKFHKIVSAVMTQISDHEDIKRIVFHIFDIFYEENPPANCRYELLQKAFNAYKADGGDCSNLCLVPYWYANSHEEIVAGKEEAVARGYEGVVIRRYCEPTANKKSIIYKMSQYGHGRSARVFKFKDTIDEEGKVIRVESAVGKESNLAVLIIKDRFDIEIPIRTGTNAERKSWLLNPKLVVGKDFTFKHIGRHPDSNVAQQPTAVGFRDYE